MIRITLSHDEVNHLITALKHSLILKEDHPEIITHNNYEKLLEKLLEKLAE